MVDERERGRLRALESCAILDTPPDPELDALVARAARVTYAPIVLISLLDRDRQWFKARYGLETTETPRDISFCTHTIEQTEPLVVRDARRDVRFAASPLVTENPKVVFYAGWPLVTDDGHAVGSLCVIDRVPRELSPNQHATMQKLAKQTVRSIEHHRALARGTVPPPVVERGRAMVATCELLDAVVIARRTVREIAIQQQAKVRISTCENSIPLFADPDVLVRVIGNLVTNAQHFAPPLSQITLSIARTWGGVWITVADFGDGIADADKERVFEATNRGLAFCGLAVAAHEGHIWIEDNRPHGTCVHVLLPNP